MQYVDDIDTYCRINKHDISATTGPAVCIYFDNKTIRFTHAAHEQPGRQCNPRLFPCKIATTNDMWLAVDDFMQKILPNLQNTKKSSCGRGIVCCNDASEILQHGRTRDMSALVEPLVRLPAPKGNWSVSIFQVN